MKHLEATAAETSEILIWERSFHSLSDDQKSLCVAMHRHRGPVPEEVLATQLDCTVEHLRSIKSGICGLLTDSYTGNVWMK